MITNLTNISLPFHEYDLSRITYGRMKDYLNRLELLDKSIIPIDLTNHVDLLKQGQYSIDDDDIYDFNEEYLYVPVYKLFLLSIDDDTAVFMALHRFFYGIPKIYTLSNEKDYLWSDNQVFEFITNIYDNNPNKYLIDITQQAGLQLSKDKAEWSKFVRKAVLYTLEEQYQQECHKEHYHHYDTLPEYEFPVQQYTSKISYLSKAILKVIYNMDYVEI